MTVRTRVASGLPRAKAIGFAGLVGAVASLSIGCHGVASVGGVVVSPSAGPIAPPIADATVTIRCPGEKAVGTSATSDGQGVFQISVETRFDRRCTVDVAREGFTPTSFVLGRFCGPGEPDDPPAYCPLKTVVVVRLEPLVNGRP